MLSAPLPRKEFSYADAMSGSLRLYVDNYHLFLSLSLTGGIVFVLRTLLDGSGIPACQAVAFILAPLAFGFGALFYMSLIFAVAKRHLNETTSFPAAVQAVFPKFWRAVGTAIVFLIVLILGTLFLVIPGVYWLTVFYFFMYIIVLEDKRIWESFEASAALVKGCFWNVLGTHWLMAVITIAFLMPFFLGMWLIGTPIVWRDAALQALGVLLMPFSVGLYYQLYVWLKANDLHAGHIAVIETQ
jgi:hypothetical protein